jgi:hypothetical protein
MKDSINTNFYFASATVIPVLFIALTLQNPLNQIRADRATTLERLIVAVLGEFTLLAGLYGEVAALVALLAQSDTPWLPGTVLAASIVLLAEVVFIQAYFIFGPLFKRKI